MQEEQIRAVATPRKEIGLAWGKAALEPVVVGGQLCSRSLQLLDADHSCVGGVDGADKVVRLINDHNAPRQPHTQSLPRLLHITPI